MANFACIECHWPLRQSVTCIMKNIVNGVMTLPSLVLLVYIPPFYFKLVDLFNYSCDNVKKIRDV